MGTPRNVCGSWRMDSQLFKLCTKDFAGEYYYLLKELYSVAGLANANGEIVEAYDYDAYGKVRIFTTGLDICDGFGDFDGDCDVDIADFEALQLCYAAGGLPGDCPNSAAALARLDSDSDGDVDDTDLIAFVAAYTGPQGGLFADGDWNSNGALGPVDYNNFVNLCYSGPGGGFNTNGCQVYDFDGDGDVDLDDFGVLWDLLYDDAPSVEITLTAAERSAVNDYFFTGRRLDLVPHGGENHQRYYYRARTYNTERFMQRDPTEHYALFIDIGNMPDDPPVAAVRAIGASTGSFLFESLRNARDSVSRTWFSHRAVVSSGYFSYADTFNLYGAHANRPTYTLDPSGLKCKEGQRCFTYEMRAVPGYGTPDTARNYVAVSAVAEAFTCTQKAKVFPKPRRAIVGLTRKSLKKSGGSPDIGQATTAAADLLLGMRRGTQMSFWYRYECRKCKCRWLCRFFGTKWVTTKPLTDWIPCPKRIKPMPTGVLLKGAGEREVTSMTVSCSVLALIKSRQACKGKVCP
jgi:hypothetical protein